MGQKASFALTVAGLGGASELWQSGELYNGPDKHLDLSHLASIEESVVETTCSTTYPRSRADSVSRRFEIV